MPPTSTVAFGGPSQSRRPRPVLVAVGSLAVVVGSALPWGGSGRVDRSGFDLARLARRLDVLDGLAAGAARLWVLAPFAVAVVVVATGARRAGLAVALGTVLAIGGAALVVAVHRSPLLPRFGLHVTAAGAAIVAVGDLVWLLTSRRTSPSWPSP